MNVLGYTKSGAIRVIFAGDENESMVPDSMANRHRQMIAEWEAEGNTIPPYVPPTVDPWDTIRSQRDALLKETDWYTLRAWEQGSDLPSNIATYRQALRDITLQPDPLNLVWPDEPI